MSLNLLFQVIYVSILLCSEVQGTLTPDGTVPLDCGSQQTFTCSVTGVAALWTISGLSVISVTEKSGQRAANTSSSRITTTDTHGTTQSSTITITGFNTSDNGGTIQCINLADNSVQGMASISVGIPSCSNGVDLAHSTSDVSLTWQQPPNTPPVTSTTVTYCPTSSPNCGNSVNCTSPCTIRGLLNDTEYQFTVIPNNNCGSPTACTGNTVTRHVLFHSEICSLDTTPSTGICPKSTLQSSTVVEAPLLAGVIPTVVLLLVNIISVIVVFLITRHCYKKTSQKRSPSKGEDVYDQVEGPKTYEDIVMTDSPAYGPVK